MKSSILFGMILISACLFWSCNEKEGTITVEEDIQLKSVGAAGALVPCDPEYIPLIAGQNSNIGQLIIYNDSNILRVEFEANPSHTLSEVHLWAGTEINKVPKNKNNIPVIGKFPYHLTNTSDYSFTIDLSDIDEPEALLNGKSICLFAHALVIDNETGKEESAWSAGENLSSKRWSMFTSYTCCFKARGTSGCYPQPASCGLIIDEEYIYNTKKGGDQIIYAENGAVAGTVIYTNSNFYFNFSQNWMFTGLLGDPVVEVHGYYSPLDEGTQLFSGKPTFNSGGPYTVAVSYYPYYKLKLKIQHCR